MSSETPRKTYLGLDLSTQQAKAIVIDDGLNVLCEAAVNFDSELPEFRTHGGVHTHSDQLTVTAPTLMWVKAIDLVLEKIKVAGVDFGKIVALSGTGQQHGSIYWKNGSRDLLRNLRAEKFLHDQLQSSFVLRDSPVWMDSSTATQCKELEDKVGGAQRLSDITGSRGYERFTGPQITKLFQTRPEAYRNTERISLVSSFLASLFLGDYASIDDSDASGMNLLDIHTRDWSDICLQACAPQLREKLGDAVPAHTNLGPISAYYVERYGFSADCSVIAFTGDNPASLAGMRLRQGDIAVSLGTSDTVFMCLDTPQCGLEGHILCNPVDSAWMALLCFKNGSLTRERIRNANAEHSWDLFDQLLDSTPRGNFNNIGMFFDIQEIMPAIDGDHRFYRMQRVARFSKEVEIRALVEGQFLRMRVHAENLGYKIGGTDSRVLATGGASANKTLLQVLADVFNTTVYVQDVPNSACLGSAYRAKHGLLASQLSFQDVVSMAPEMTLAAEPHTDSEQVYNPMVERYRKLEQEIVAEQRK